MHHGCAVPEQCHVHPRERAGDSRDMHKAGRARVSKVQRVEVEEVDDEQQLGPPEAAAAPQHDEAEGEQVVEDEVAAHVGGGGDAGRVGAEQPLHVAQLQREECDPVDARQQRRQVEGRVVLPVLPEDGAVVAVVGRAVLLPVAGRGEGVVDAEDDEQQPGQDCEELVAGEGAGRELLALRERVDCVRSRQQEEQLGG